MAKPFRTRWIPGGRRNSPSRMCRPSSTFHAPTKWSPFAVRMTTPFAEASTVASGSLPLAGSRFRRSEASAGG
jgi:hypothetical protein